MPFHGHKHKSNKDRVSPVTDSLVREIGKAGTEKEIYQVVFTALSRLDQWTDMFAFFDAYAKVEERNFENMGVTRAIEHATGCLDVLTEANTYSVFSAFQPQMLPKRVSRENADEWKTVFLAAELKDQYRKSVANDDKLAEDSFHFYMMACRIGRNGKLLIRSGPE